jgi:hypothetical protein
LRTQLLRQALGVGLAGEAAKLHHPTAGCGRGGCRRRCGSRRPRGGGFRYRGRRRRGDRIHRRRRARSLGRIRRCRRGGCERCRLRRTARGRRGVVRVRIVREIDGVGA